MPPTNEAPSQLQPSSPSFPERFREAIDDCLNRAVDGTLTVIPHSFKAPSAKVAFNDAFELVGGIPRLALWADKNYGSFLSLFSKTLPLTVAGDPDRPLKFEVPWLAQTRFSAMRPGGPLTVDAEPAADERQLPLFPE